MERDGTACLFMVTRTNVIVPLLLTPLLMALVCKNKQTNKQLILH